MTNHAEADELVALALRDVGAADEARLLEHLAQCDRCRLEYLAVELDVQRVLPAAPAVAPPAGFSGRVLDRMGLSGQDAAAAPGPGTTAGRRRVLASVLAALLAGLVLGVGGTVAWSALRPSPGPPSYAPGAASPLLTADGEAVGSAGISATNSRELLFVAVTRARPGASYDCVVVGQDGQRRDAGTWSLDAGYGSEQASGTWVVPLPEGGIQRLELVGQSGRVWSSAEFS